MSVPSKALFSSASAASLQRPPVQHARLSSNFFKYARLFTTASGLAVTCYTLGSLYPPDVATLISPRTAPPPPHPDDPSAIAYVAELEDSLHNLPLLNAHRVQDDADQWYETRPYLNIPEERRVNSLTAGALKGPGKLALPPLVRSRYDHTESWIFLHVGRGLCGHEGVVHGGLLATLLDESLARTALLNLPDKVGVTANLTLNYRAPTRADQFIVIKTRLQDVNGRKVRVTGTIEDMQGVVLVEASALFVQPRYAKLLNSNHIKRMIGAPESQQESLASGNTEPVSATLRCGAHAMNETRT
ncbi:hypothetical protein A0H81_01640 [Grifola frondosa]|uniref:Thioesterase domain-containing protein n=1 Tax=Grifola frondosa TaxID=5627 RepID=A0A1C7MKE4_GRIFR|nr:hypothetical protein A0H81_01640 [Grifola frondosa]